MVSFVYLCITSGFCCQADRRCADTHFRAMPTSHLFEVALAVDGSELSSKKVSNLSRRYSRLKKKISTMADDPTTNAWMCPAWRGRRPPKARGAASTAPRESPQRGAKDKANERIAAQLAQRTMVPVASSPDGPLAPPPAAARAGAGIVDVTGGDSDDSDGSPLRPLRGLGLKTTGLELGDSSPNFSPNNSPESPTDREMKISVNSSTFERGIRNNDRNSPYRSEVDSS